MLTGRVKPALLSSKSLLNHRTVFNTCAASGTQVHVDAAGALSDFDLEIPCRTFDSFKIRVCDQFDVQMPADLDEDGRNNSHRTVIGRKGLIQLGHSAADGRRFFKQINIVPGVCQIQGRLHSGNSASCNQHRSDYIFFRHCFILLIFLKKQSVFIRNPLETELPF
jgi:hypothetical protein